MSTRILIVDDSRTVRSFLEHHLKPEFEVEIAEDGRRGLERAEEEHFDIVLSDVNMPHLGGFALRQNLAESKPDLPIALMTDGDIDSYLPEVARAKVHNVFSKFMMRLDFQAVSRFLRDLSCRQTVGMERRLGTGGEIRTYILSAPSDYQRILADCTHLLKQFPRRDIYENALLSLVRYFDPTGQNNGRVPVSEASPMIISVGADWQRLGIGVRESSGRTMWREACSGFIPNRSFNVDSGLVACPFAACRRLMDQVFVNVAPGHLTEVLCFDLLSGYQGPKPFHVNELELAVS